MVLKVSENSKRGFLFGGIAVLVLAGLVVGFRGGKKAPPVREWKSYDAFNITLKEPAAPWKRDLGFRSRGERLALCGLDVGRGGRRRHLGLGGLTGRLDLAGRGVRPSASTAMSFTYSSCLPSSTGLAPGDAGSQSCTRPS